MKANSKERHRVPDFFIVGAAKAGTTSLFHYLAQHPGLFLPTIDKEPGYYCDSWGTKEPEYYFGLFARCGPEQLAGEASTPYLTCPASAGLIYADNPQAKIIILLRNPAQRAFSLYLQMVKTGLEAITPFEKALVAEPKRAARDPHARPIPGYYYNFLYFASGCYEEQVRRYYETFPRDQILVALFDDMVGDPQGTVKRTLEFLGVDSDFRFSPEVFNPSRYPRFVRLQNLLKRGLEDPSRAIGTHRGVLLASKLKELNLRFGTAPRLSDKSYNLLVKRYESSVRATSDLIGRDLSPWLRERESP